MSVHKVIKHNKFGYKDSVFYLKIERNGLNFEPGSCASMFNRTYSIASAATNLEYLEFFIKLVPNGEASTKFNNLNVNDNVTIDEVFSYFTPGKNKENEQYTYFATGTGFAPFRSALLTYKHKPHTFFWGGKTIEDSFDLETFKDIKKILAHSVYQPSWLASRITQELKHVKIDKNHTYYLCGLDAMIDEISNYLIQNGITYQQIETEQFFQKT